MGEIQPNNKSAGCPSMLAQQVAYVLLALGCLLVPVCLVNWALTSL